MERQTQAPLPKFRSPGTAPLVQLLSELGSLASVYHKPAASFVSKLRLAVQRADDLAARAAAARTSGSGEGAWRGRRDAGIVGSVCRGWQEDERQQETSRQLLLWS